MKAQSSAPRLLAVLLNPPSTSSGARTIGAVRRATDVLGFGSYEVTNLFAESTPTVVELNGVVADEISWGLLRTRLAEQLRTMDGVLAAWGISGASGQMRHARDERAAWLLAEAELCGHDFVWTVGGAARHPSRWHQYVADRHGRTAGGSFDERLSQVLVATPTASVNARQRTFP